MELVVAVAIGLNPYVASFFLSGLGAFTGRLPETGLLGSVPHWTWYAAVVLFGLAVPVDLVLCKFIRWAPSARRVSGLLAPAAAGLFAAGVSRSELPLPVVAMMAAAGAWMVSKTVTALAARASRSPAWVGLGHIPVLMAATTTAACLLPLGLARPAAGMVPAVLTLAVLAWGTFAGQPAGQPASRAVRPDRPHRRVRLIPERGTIRQGGHVG